MIREQRTITCYLIRHGKTEGNLQKRYIGCKSDEDLCPQGEEELARLQFPQDFPVGAVDAVYTSPMKRAVQTALILFPDKTPIPQPGLTEMNFGIFEGKNYEELKHNEVYRRWIDSGGRMAIPEGEDLSSFQTRTMASFEHLVHHIPDSITSLAIVCHGGNIMSIMSHLFSEEYYHFQVGNGEGYQLILGVSEDELTAISYHRLFPRCSP